MNNLFTRAISGALYVVLLYLTIWYGPLSLILFFVFLTATGLSEFYRLTDTKKKKTENRGLKLLIGSLVYLSLAAPFLHFPGFDIAWLNNLYIPLVFSAFFLVLFSSHKNPVHELTRTLTGFIYVVAPLALAIRIPVQAEAYRPELLLGIFILIWCSDTFAYLVGSRLGKTPLAPRLSPKKNLGRQYWRTGLCAGSGFSNGDLFPRIVPDALVDSRSYCGRFRHFWRSRRILIETKGRCKRFRYHHARTWRHTRSAGQFFICRSFCVFLPADYLTHCL